MCVYVACCECGVWEVCYVVESSGYVFVFCEVVWVCCVSWWDVYVYKVNVFVFVEVKFYGLQFCLLDVDVVWDLDLCEWYCVFDICD